MITSPIHSSVAFALRSMVENLRVKPILSTGPTNKFSSKAFFFDPWLIRTQKTQRLPVSYSSTVNISSIVPKNDSIMADSRGQSTKLPTDSQKKLQQSQAQVDEVVGIMRVNVEKVLERDQKLSELDNRADVLQQGASQFEQQATKLKRKMWWKNLKMMILLGVIVTVILILIVYSFIS